MSETTIDVLIEGGQATAAPPLGPALGPLGVNIGEVVNAINDKTESFEGMQVPVTVVVDSETKEYDIQIGTPPASALIKQECELDTASGNPGKDYVSVLKIEHMIKVATMKEDDLAGKNLKNKVKEIIGTCRSMGIKIDGMKPAEALEKVNAGEFDDKIEQRKTDISEEEQESLKEQQEELKRKREQRFARFEEKAKEINDQMIMEGAEINEIREAMKDVGIPQVIINKVAPLPTEEGVEGV